MKNRKTNAWTPWPSRLVSGNNRKLNSKRDTKRELRVRIYPRGNIFGGLIPLQGIDTDTTVYSIIMQMKRNDVVMISPVDEPNQVLFKTRDMLMLDFAVIAKFKNTIPRLGDLL